MNFKYMWAWIALQAHCLRHIFALSTDHREVRDGIIKNCRGERPVVATKLRCYCGKEFYRSDNYNAIEAECNMDGNRGHIDRTFN